MIFPEGVKTDVVQVNVSEGCWVPAFFREEKCFGANYPLKWMIGMEIKAAIAEAHARGFKTNRIYPAITQKPTARFGKAF